MQTRFPRLTIALAAIALCTTPTLAQPAATPADASKWHKDVSSCYRFVNLTLTRGNIVIARMNAVYRRATREVIIETSLSLTHPRHIRVLHGR